MRKSISIRTYLGFSYLLLLVTSLGTIGFILSRNEYQIITNELEKLMRERVSLLANILSHEISEHGEVNFEVGEFPIFNQVENLVAVYIAENGSVFELLPGTVSQSQSILIQQMISAHPVYEDAFVILTSEYKSAYIYAAAPVKNAQNQSLGVVCLLLPVDALNVYISYQRWILLGAIIFVAFLGVGISILLTNYLSQQFSQAQKLAATVSEGKYHIRIPETGPAEFRDLLHYMNLMASKLQEQLKTRQHLLSNVAHELARPLGGLQLGIESLRKGAIQDPDLSDDLLVSMEQTIQRLDSLIDDITLAAQSDIRPIELNLTMILIEPFLRGVVTRFWPLADARDIQIEVHVDADLPPVLADEKRLNQIVGNLVDNAIKFTPPGGVVQLFAATLNANNLRLMVKDGGAGISPEEAEHLFEPFYQGDIGRRIKQGMGLGLSIAQQLARAHGGSLTLENHLEGGTIAILTLPTTDA